MAGKKHAPIACESWKRLSDDLSWCNRRGNSFSLNTGSRGGSLTVDSRDDSDRTVDLKGSLGAVPADVAGLAAPVAGLAGRVGGAAIGRRAVTADVAELAAGVALHSLGLAVTGEVVGATALVALSSAVVLDTSVAAAEATAGSTSATTDWGNRGSAWSWAVARNVAILAARVAAVVAGTTAQAQSRAVSLNMAEALAVVALLALGGPGGRACVALVARLLAVVAQALSAGADLGVVTDVAALVACATSK